MILSFQKPRSVVQMTGQLIADLKALVLLTLYSLQLTFLVFRNLTIPSEFLGTGCATMLCDCYYIKN